MTVMSIPLVSATTRDPDKCREHAAGRKDAYDNAEQRHDPAECQKPPERGYRPSEAVVGFAEGCDELNGCVERVGMNEEGDDAGDDHGCSAL